MVSDIVEYGGVVMGTTNYYTWPEVEGFIRMCFLVWLRGCN